MKTLLAVCCLLAVVVSSPAPDSDFTPYKGSKEFERIKSLAGSWEGKHDFGGGEMAFKVQYRVISGGSAVEERIFSDTPQEMVTIYTDRKGKLGLIHYCMLKNQPALNMKSAKGNQISFDFDKSCGIDAKKEAHMHSLVLTFPDKDNLVQEWSMQGGGKKKETSRFALKRVAAHHAK